MAIDHLKELLHTYWFAPPVALWRAVEVREAAQETYVPPLLDVGCGDGLIAQALFGDEGYVDVGCDIWPEQLAQAVASGAYRHVDLADAAHLPYPDRSFTTAFSNSVLEHIPDVRPVLREVSRVLRPEGQFIFTVPSDAFPTMLDGYIKQMAAGDPEGAQAYVESVNTLLAHHHYHTPEEWEELLDGVGMRMVRSRYYVPEATERHWDRMNRRYGIGRERGIWRVLASPRLRSLGYQDLLRRMVVWRLSHTLRIYYDLNVSPVGKGGGLLVVAQKEPA
jgi:SAM-dependent methyltransferase